MEVKLLFDSRFCQSVYIHMLLLSCATGEEFGLLCIFCCFFFNFSVALSVATGLC